MSGAGAGDWLSTKLSVPEHPVALVTVTVYVPGALTVMDWVVSPVDQSYVLKASVTFSTAEAPGQKSAGPLMVGCGAATTVREMEERPGQFWARSDKLKKRKKKAPKRLVGVRTSCLMDVRVT